MTKTLFVPGRLCLFGEHSDWAGKYRTMNASLTPGKAIVTGIEQGIEADIEESDSFEVRSTAAELQDIWTDFKCPMDIQKLKEVAHSKSFFSYCAGVASYMLEWYHVGGLKITIRKMTLPIKSGLSSSASICVLVARAFNMMYSLNLNTMGEMNIAYWGEQRTASRCGRLDQACAFGVSPVVMTFDAEEVEVEKFNIGAAFHWVFSDLNGEKDTIKILSDLNKGYPFATTKEEENLQNALGTINQDIIGRAITAMRDGDAEALGLLMNEAQSVFDQYVTPMSPEQLRSPKLHAMFKDETVKRLTYGSKGVGSHGDGSIQFLAKSKEAQDELVKYLRGKGLHAYPLTIKPKHTIRKAIVPVAGFGTRLYPETRMLKKDFFPVIDKDGMVKPVILILLEELVKSGIEQICIVLGSDEEREQYRQFFERSLSEEHLSKLNKESRDYERFILELSNRLVYVTQKEKRGFGHAVYQCRDFAAGDPVLLLLGDTLYQSETNIPCALQLIETYERKALPMMAIHKTPLEKVSYYGIATGRWVNKDSTIMQMSKIYEKPTMSYAEEFLGTTEGDGSKSWYSAFGQYILTSDVFQQLGDNIKCGACNSKGEFELTAALEQIRQTHGLLGIVLKGKMFDMGNPEALRYTIQHYGVQNNA